MRGASETIAVVTELMKDLRQRGLHSDLPRLFAIHGGKALRSAADGVYGDHASIQRCRNQKVRNVLDNLPDKKRAHTKLVLRAAFNLEDAGKGVERLRDYAADLARSGWSSASGDLREGLKELLTVHALGLPPAF